MGTLPIEKAHPQTGTGQLVRATTPVPGDYTEPSTSLRDKIDYLAVVGNGSQDRRRLLDNISSLGPLLRRDIRFWLCDPAPTTPDSLDDNLETTRLRQRVLHLISYSVTREERFVNL